MGRNVDRQTFASDSEAATQVANTPEVPAEIKRIIAAEEEPFAIQLDHLLATDEVKHTVGIAKRVFEIAEKSTASLETGQEIEVTEAAMVLEIDGKDHFCRLGRPSTSRLKKKESDVWLIFDQSDDHEEVITNNPWSVRVEVGDDMAAGVYVSGRGIGDIPRVNEHSDIGFVRDVLRGLASADQDLKERKRFVKRIFQTVMSGASEKLEIFDRYRKGIKADRKLAYDKMVGYHPYTPYPRSIKRRAGAVMLAMVAAAGFGVVEASDNPTAPESFDAQGYDLDGGTVIAIGGSGKPEFSFELLNNDHLDGDSIPQIGDHGDNVKGRHKETSQGAGKTIDGGQSPSDALTLGQDGLRAFNMHVGHEGEKNCETVYVRFETPDDVVRAWTAEENRVNEFSVEVGSDKITACWEGQEASADDDPDIVIKVETPEPGSR